MAYLDRGIGEAYVSPQIEATLGFSQSEWLGDPVLWYRQVHPDDKERWSVEASEMFLSGKPLRSAYRVVSRDGRVIWFHCEAKMIRRPDGRPWFIHGVAFDITDLKRTEQEFEDQRNVVSAILDTVGALVLVLDREGRIVRFNRACEQMSGQTLEHAIGQRVWDVFLIDEEKNQFKEVFQTVWEKQSRTEYETSWVAGDGKRRTIAWSAAVLPAAKQTPSYVIASGIDVTDQKAGASTFSRIARSSSGCGRSGQPGRKNRASECASRKAFRISPAGTARTGSGKLVPSRLRRRHPAHRKTSSRNPEFVPWAEASSYTAFTRTVTNFRWKSV